MTARLGAFAAVLVLLLGLRLAAQPADGAASRHAAARPVLTDVLAQPAFVRASRSSWQKRLEEQILDWLRDVASRLLTPLVGRRDVAQLFAWVASIAAFLVLLFWLVRVAVRQRAERPLALDTGAIAAQPGHVLGAEAAALIRAGRIREGARTAYRAAIRRLEEDGALRADPSRTPREQLRELAPSHRRAAPLAAMTSVFEAIWYGARPAGPEEGSRLLRLLGELECLPSERAK